MLLDLVNLFSDFKVQLCYVWHPEEVHVLDYGYEPECVRVCDFVCVCVRL